MFSRERLKQEKRTYSDIIKYEDDVIDSIVKAFIEQEAEKTVERRGITNEKYEEIKEIVNRSKDDWYKDVIIKLNGNRGRRMTLWPEKCEIITDVTIGSILSGNSIDGRKMIYFEDVISVQFKKAG